LLPRPPPPRSTLFPYTTLFRSHIDVTLFQEALLHGLQIRRVVVVVRHLGEEVCALVVHATPKRKGRGLRLAGREVVALENVDHRSEEHTSELQSRFDLVCRLLL